MQAAMLFLGNVILPDRAVHDWALWVTGGQIVHSGPQSRVLPKVPHADALQILAQPDEWLVPGFVDIHVHGGAGADFMDGTPEAFVTILRAHALHGTTSLTPTTTVAMKEQILRVLGLVREFRAKPGPGLARVLGAHLYGPYFAPGAVGCHPTRGLVPPETSDIQAFLAYADDIANATVAVELPGAEQFAKACAARGVRVNCGHSQATFVQMEQALTWGVRHVDHLFCAMSDKTKLRALCPYPMQGGVQEATLFFEELTTEVIADGKHLSPDLLRLAHRIKGAHKLALVTDCSRALDMPDGEYLFGPADGGEPFVKRDGVGVMPGGTGLASSVQGMDHMLQTMHQQTGISLVECVRMAALTPAEIAGHAQQIGSLEVGKRADINLLGADLRVKRTWICGEEVPRA